MATSGGAIRISVLDEARGGAAFDVFDVVDFGETIVLVRTPFLFEIGEELAVRIEHDGSVFEAQLRVRAHTGPRDARTTELEILARSAPRSMVSG